MLPELIRKGQPQDNAYVERSHGTDDTELYIPWLTSVKTEREFLGRMCWWQQTYNLARPHSGRAMNDRTPYEKLKQSGTKGVRYLLW
jgi:transposase InsO family protein